VYTRLGVMSIVDYGVEAEAGHIAALAEQIGTQNRLRLPINDLRRVSSLPS
jgi:hypothetical protein